MSYGNIDTSKLPANIAGPLLDFTQEALATFSDSLLSLVLYGSAAEGRLRTTSNVNVVFVLKEFKAAQAKSLRDPLRTAHAIIRIEPMFLLSEEVQVFLNTSALKSTDILRTRSILFGSDPFLGLRLSPEIILSQVDQALFQIRLRLRNHFISKGRREEQLALTLAEITSPLRSIAAALLELEGRAFESRKAALEQLSSELGLENPQSLLSGMSEARDRMFLAPGLAEAAILRSMALCDLLLQHQRSLAAKFS